MAVKFLDNTGLGYFWSKIKAWCNATFAAITHNHASNAVNVMTGYSKPSSGSAIAASDSLNSAIGKLEAKVDAVDQSNVVHIIGNETISSNKIFTCKRNAPDNDYNYNYATSILNYQSNDISKDTTPSSNQYLSFLFLDKNYTNNSVFNLDDRSCTLGLLEYTTYASSSYTMKMSCWDRNVLDNFANLAVGFDNANIAFATAPSTSTTRINGTDIVTRNFIPNDTRIVHTTNNELIDGGKYFKFGISTGYPVTQSGLQCVSNDPQIIRYNTFTDSHFMNFSFWDYGMQTATLTTDTDYRNHILGSIQWGCRSGNRTDMSILCTKNDNTNYDYAALRVGFDENGESFCVCPSTSQTRTTGNDVVTRNFLHTVAGAKQIFTALYNTKSPANTYNFNDYTDSGIFAFSTAVSLVNCPVGSNGFLIVLVSDDRIRQFWLRTGTYDSNDHQFYFRIGDKPSSGPITNASSWHKIYTNSDTIPISNGGTGATTVAAAQTALDCMTLSTDQTVTGSKIYERDIKMRHTGVDYANLTSTNRNSAICVFDKNNKIYAALHSRISTSYNGWRFTLRQSEDTDSTAYTSFDGVGLYYSYGTGSNGTNVLNFSPTQSGVYLGQSSSSGRWDTIYARNTTISTSDKRTKDSIQSISENMLNYWETVNWVEFKFKDAIKEKGIDKARIHAGIIAQDLDENSKSFNIDLTKYGFFCYDEWKAIEPEIEIDGTILDKGQEAGNLYSIRYEEALCIEAAYQRRKNKILENRISELEKQVSDMLQILQNLTSNNG